MRLFRRQLSWILASWLVFQLVGITAPVALGALGIVDVHEECTCPGVEDGATCPMHHGPSSTKSQANPCALQNASAPIEIAVLALAGGAGVLPRLLLLDVVDQPVTSVSIELANTLSRTNLPDSPPPRA